VQSSSPSTRVFEATDVHALRAFARLEFPQLRFPRRVNGLAQGHIGEVGGVEARLHVWHPSLVAPETFGRGDVHDHHLTLRSTVICGAIVHEEIEAEADPEGEWTLWHAETTNAPGARVERAPTRVSIRARRRFRIEAGSAYTFAPGVLHRTEVDDLAITIATAHDPA
jgi:hypothetical protein